MYQIYKDEPSVPWVGVENQQQIYNQLNLKNTRMSQQKFYREISGIDFPVKITCTLQGSSVTQGNPASFTAKTFAVCMIMIF